MLVIRLAPVSHTRQLSSENERCSTRRRGTLPRYAAGQNERDVDPRKGRSVLSYKGKWLLGSCFSRTEARMEGTNRCYHLRVVRRSPARKGSRPEWSTLW
jgi:hypothetical protein